MPRRVEYEITAKARGLGPTLETLTTWWTEHGKRAPPKPRSGGRKVRSGG